MRPVKKVLLLATYYCVLQWLPSSRRFGGLPGRLRRWCCRGLFRYCGKNTNIERRAFFGSGREVSLGDNSGIGVNAKLSPGVTIGKNVLMGEDVLFLTRNHAFADPEVLIRDQGYLGTEEILVDDDVWIGTRCILLPGVHVGTGAVIGAGSVVTKSVEPCAVVAGNPAVVIGRRT
jgi:maltose O-acetyltransferase